MSPLAAAIIYAAKGIAVFRLRPRAKEPVEKGGFKTATTSVQQLRTWWNDGRANFNVGIATGAVSGFWVLDLDGDQAEAALVALQAKHGALPATVEQATGKGRHLCFAWDPDRPVRNLSKRSRERIGAEIDVRGDGGYIVAPPSIHPSGRVYAWSPGRSPAETAFAKAPAWLMDLVVPPVSEVAASAVKPKPRVKIEGAATPYGEAALANACRTISGAPGGRQDSTLWETACSIGRLCAGGEIETRYAFGQLVDAGLSMAPVGKPWLKRDIEDKVERAFTWAVDFPRSAPEQRGAAPAARPAAPGAKPSAGGAAIAVSDAQALWDAGRSAWVRSATSWLEARGLQPSPPAIASPLVQLRAHASAPCGRGRVGPALLFPMFAPGRPTLVAVAILPLHPAVQRFTHFVGDPGGCATALTPLDGRGDLLVAIDLQDGWALAQRSAAPVRVVIVPTLSGFAGGALGDKYGRVDLGTPRADPDRPPWRIQNPGGVYLAVRRDLRGPDLRQRKSAGGTMSTRLEGESAARFYGALAEQHWRAAGANPVRVLTPTAGAHGFNSGRER